MPDPEDTRDISRVRIGGQKNGNGVRRGGMLIPTSAIVTIGVGIAAAIAWWVSDGQAIIQADTVEIDMEPVTKAISEHEKSRREVLAEQTRILEASLKLLDRQTQIIERMDRQQVINSRLAEETNRDLREHRRSVE